MVLKIPLQGHAGAYIKQARLLLGKGAGRCLIVEFTTKFKDEIIGKEKLGTLPNIYIASHRIMH
jgi:hypothetical protein